MSDIKSYLRSWFEGIRTGLQSNLAVSLGFGSEFVLVNLGEEDVELFQCRGKRIIWSGKLDQKNFSSKLNKLKGDQFILIPKEDFVTFHLSIPKVAEHSIEQLLESEIERRTAFHYDEVKTDHFVLGSEGTHVNLLVYVVPKKKLTAIYETATKEGLKPQRFVAQNTDNLAEYGGTFMLESSSSDKHSRLRIMAAILILTLFVTALVSPFIERHWSYERLLAENKRITPLSEDIHKRKQKFHLYEEQVKTINKFSRQQPTVVAILDEVSKILPDTAWIRRFHLKDNELVLQGFASNALDVVAILGSSAMFESPSLRSPITREPEKEIERFNLVVRVRF